MKSRLFYLLVSVTLFISQGSLADEVEKPQLNTIHTNIVVEKWVQTSTAKVVVSVDAVVDKAGLEKTHQHLMQKLGQISSAAEWHITNFNRSQDPSGLEKVYVEAEARLPENALTGLRENAEKVSKPGEKFEIVNVFFEPTLEDIQRTRESLRAELYDKVKNELARINKLYPEQKYFLHRVVFDGVPVPVAQQNNYKAEMRMAAVASAPADMGVTVSNKIQQSAYVIFGSKVE